MNNRRKGYQDRMIINFTKRNIMEIMTICALVIMIYMPELVGLLESVK
jgi:hypothetical protein